MRFRVYEVKTNKDVTDEREWVVNIDGDLRYILGGSRMYVSKGQYYYKLEIDII